MTQEIKPSELPWFCRSIGPNDEGYHLILSPDKPTLQTIVSSYIEKANAEFIILAVNNFYPLLEACKNLLKLIEYETDLPYSAANGNLSPNGILDEGVVMTKNLINTAIDVVKNAEAQGTRDE